METKNILQTLEKLKKESKKRNFKQSVDFSIALKEVDVTGDGKIDEFLVLPEPIEKPIKICALVDKELVTQAREVCDKVITKDEFSKWAGKKAEIKKLINECDFFIAQANIMTDVASVFGKQLGPKGKMPNPKAGGVVPPKIDLKPLIARLKKTIRIQTKKQPVISTRVGLEGMDDEKIAKNAIAVYNLVQGKLPRGDQQIKKSYLKFTMSKPVIVE